MNRFWAFLPHLCLALQAALMVVLILDLYNPVLGLLRGVPFLALAGLAAVSAMAVSLRLIVLRHRRENAARRAFLEACEKERPD